MPEKNAICPNGDAVRYEPLRCRRVECPDCYRSEDREQAFRICREIQAVAETRDDSPHAVVFSVPPSEGRSYSIKELNEDLMQRGYKRAKEQCGINGGYAFVHPARIPDRVKEKLRAKGYGSGGENGGLWVGVRDDALDVEDWRRYAEYSPHGHSIGFPGFIEPHEGEDFLIRKYDSLDTLGSLVRHVRYLMSHRGVFKGEDTFRAIRPWGEMHHAADGWDGAEEELSESAYEDLCRRVAAELGGEWSSVEGLHFPDREAPVCPNCGTPKRDFIDLWNLPSLASSGRMGGSEWRNRLSESQRVFFDHLVSIISSSNQPVVMREDLHHPEDVAVMVDGDRPPP